jgi:hypothetical protein
VTKPQTEPTFEPVDSRLRGEARVSADKVLRQVAVLQDLREEIRLYAKEYGEGFAK